MWASLFLFYHEAGTVFLYAGKVTMAHHFGGGVIGLQPVEELLQRGHLGRCAGVSRPAADVETALVADADAAAIEARSMGTLGVEGTARMHYPVACDVVVVADVGKAPVTVVATAVVHGVATGDAGGTTMYHDEIDGAVLLVLAAV